VISYAQLVAVSAGLARIEVPSAISRPWLTQDVRDAEAFHATRRVVNATRSLRHGQEYRPRSALSFKRLWCGYLAGFLCGRIDMNELAKKLLRPVTRRAPAFVKQWWKVKPIDLKLHIASGHPGIDRYLAESYQRVRGMSSRFAAAICGHLIQRQTALGIDGELVEIGTLEGRFFIAMALGLATGERALGIDRFDWPDPGVEDRFLANCAAHGISSDRYVSWKADSREITAGELRKKLRERPVRFVHIDSHHSRECLTNDLDLVNPVLHRHGIICLDDMLHPGYPMMVAAVFDYFACHPELCLLCVIDREDIAAAPKFLICRHDSRALYEQDLLKAFSRFHYVINADMETYFALVLTPRPRLDDIG
jgi:Methyltransferase domain